MLLKSARHRAFRKWALLRGGCRRTRQERTAPINCGVPIWPEYTREVMLNPGIRPLRNNAVPLLLKGEIATVA